MWNYLVSKQFLCALALPSELWMLSEVNSLSDTFMSTSSPVSRSLPLGASQYMTVDFEMAQIKSHLFHFD